MSYGVELCPAWEYGDDKTSRLKIFVNIWRGSAPGPLPLATKQRSLPSRLHNGRRFPRFLTSQSPLLQLFSARGRESRHDRDSTTRRGTDRFCYWLRNRQRPEPYREYPIASGRRQALHCGGCWGKPGQRAACGLASALCGVAVKSGVDSSSERG